MKTTTRLDLAPIQVHSFRRLVKTRKGATVCTVLQKCYRPPWISNPGVRMRRSSEETRSNAAALAARSSSRCARVCARVFVYLCVYSRVAFGKNANLPPGSLSMRQSGASLSIWRISNVPNLGQGATFLAVGEHPIKSWISICLVVVRVLTLRTRFSRHVGACARSWRSARRSWSRRRRYGAKRIRQARNGAHGGARSRGRRFVHSCAAFKTRTPKTKSFDTKCQLTRCCWRLWRRRRRSRGAHC